MVRILSGLTVLALTGVLSGVLTGHLWSRYSEETEALARSASRGSVASKAFGKRAFYETIDLDVEAAYAKACEVMATSAMAEDGREAMRSFLEKRPGVYPPRR